MGNQKPQFEVGQTIPRPKEKVQKDRQYHDQRKKYKRTDNGRQNIKQKTKY